MTRLLKELKKYRVDIAGLQNKRYEYDFEVGNAFFEHFEKSLVKKANLKVEAILEKSETMILIDFRIRGFVNLVCDRRLGRVRPSDGSAREVYL